MTPLNFTAWFVLGLVAALPLLRFAHRLRLPTATKLMGRSLVIAAAIYLLFALIWGDAAWLGIEFLGLLIYGGFYWLRPSSMMLVGIGWLLHPAWDAGLHLLGPGQHVAPGWYAVACLSFDLAVAAYCFYRVQHTPATLESGKLD